ncbi:MAG TPA: hypothetical protein VFZ65_11810 [Planctomycetota bacterium]|nr:hypothetical protein [Planctomycetota bacterium]
MMLTDLFTETVGVDVHGRAVVRVRCPGTHSVSGRITGSRRMVRGFTPRELNLPGEGVIMLRLGAKELQAVLDDRGR